jgi:hypothetical protein
LLTSSIVIAWAEHFVANLLDRSYSNGLIAAELLLTTHAPQSLAEGLGVWPALVGAAKTQENMLLQQWDSMQVTVAALIEAIARHGPAALKLEPVLAALMQLLQGHQDAWAELQAAHGSALAALIDILRATNTPEACTTFPGLAESVHSSLMDATSVGLLLQHALRGPDASAGHSAACLHHLAQQRGFSPAWIGPSGFQVRTNACGDIG